MLIIINAYTYACGGKASVEQWGVHILLPFVSTRRPSGVQLLCVHTSHHSSNFLRSRQNFLPANPRIRRNIRRPPAIFTNRSTFFQSHTHAHLPLIASNILSFVVCRHTNSIAIVYCLLLIQSTLCTWRFLTYQKVRLSNNNSSCGSPQNTKQWRRLTDETRLAIDYSVA